MNRNTFLMLYSSVFIANLDWISGECRWTHKEKGEWGFEMCLICMPSYVLIIMLTLADDYNQSCQTPDNALENIQFSLVI